MGLFRAVHDTVVAADLLKAANAINDYQRSIINITNRYGNSTRLEPTDKMLIKGYLNSIEDKVIYMRNRLQDIAPYTQFKTMVPCLDGHMTAAPGYIMAMYEMVQHMRQEINNY